MPWPSRSRCSPLVHAGGVRRSGDKWADLRKAAGLLPARDGTVPPEGARDWVFLDVRFERGDMALRPDPSAEPPAKSNAGKSSTGSGGAPKRGASTPAPAPRRNG